MDYFTSLYLVKVDWYNEFTETNEKDVFYAFAKNLEDLSKRIDNCYPDAEHINIERIEYECGSSGFLYVTGLSKDLRDKINEVNRIP